ncbi:hypothetical protein [Alkalicoccus urumqiensis]|uniref:Uncharacterized protein n=1 Tax=Alkalicoccus urumqiensis TaxID=1548213 RepID=A0A2P6MJP5_ALKUR|nr:hypothetical protein [Alkalicoccus urumqiensis]PRO66491.1 hypothetical protein C6I21_03885 [Alkalicoccus urumqiensis]
MEEKYHQDFFKKDLPRIQQFLQQTSAVSDPEASFYLLVDQLEQEIQRLKRSPYQLSKPLQHGRSAALGYYACKWFSSPHVRGIKGAKPDMRLIYKYDENHTCIYLKAVGFRHEPPPIYNESEQRSDRFD